MKGHSYGQHTNLEVTREFRIILNPPYSVTYQWVRTVVIFLQALKFIEKYEYFGFDRVFFDIFGSIISNLFKIGHIRALNSLRFISSFSIMDVKGRHLR